MSDPVTETALSEQERRVFSIRTLEAYPRHTLATWVYERTAERDELADAVRAAARVARIHGGNLRECFVRLIELDDQRRANGGDDDRPA